MLSAAYGAIDALSLHPFHILLSNFSAEAMHLPKLVMLAYATDSPANVMTPRSSPHQQTSMETLERVSKSAHSDVKPAESDTDIANDEGKAVANDMVRAVH